MYQDRGVLHFPKGLYIFHLVTIHDVELYIEEVNKKILLVEDDPNFGAVLKDYLLINDFDVTLAKNGMEGFEKFKNRILRF